MTNNKYKCEAYKNEVLSKFYFDEPLALQLYSWGWRQQQDNEDHETYATRLDRYAKVLCEENALVKIKLVNRGYCSLKYTSQEVCANRKLPPAITSHGMVLRQATIKEIIKASHRKLSGGMNPRAISNGYAYYPSKETFRSNGDYKTFVKDHKNNFVVVYWVALKKILCHNVVDLITIGVK
tara:strand:+ start:1727 stop:2269 length:543 start_codon:yes stop_codon:yes gene_type:complete